MIRKMKAADLDMVAQICGFIGLAEDHIAGIFVRGEAQSRGIGKELLDQVKRGKKKESTVWKRKN